MKFALLVACVELAAAATRYDNATLGNGTSSMVHSGASVTTSYEGLGFSTNPTSHTAASSKGLAKWILNGLGGGGAESGMTSTLSSTLDHSDKNGQLSHTSTWASHSSLSATNSSALLEKGDSVGLSGAGSSNVSTAPLYTSGSGLANSRFPDSADLNGSTTTMMAGWQVTNISGPATHGSAAIPTRPVLNNNTSGNSSAMTTSPFLRNHSIPQDYFSYGNVTFRTVCTVSDRIASKSCMNVCNDYKEQCSDALLEWTEAASSSLVAYHTTYITHTTNITTWPAGVSASKVVYVGHTHVPQETWFTYSSITFLSGGRTHTWSSKISSVVVPETVVTYTSTYSRVNAEPITLQSHEVREDVSTEYSYSNPTASERPCPTESWRCTACNPNRCTIQGGEVELIYWPVATQVALTVTGSNGTESTMTSVSSVTYSSPFTTTFEGVTMVYPSVYVSFQTAYATDDCGNTVGNAYPGAIVSLAPEDLSSVRGNLGPLWYSDQTTITTSWDFPAFWAVAPFNYTNLALDPVPVSVYLDQPPCYDEFCPVFYSGYRPYLSVPQEVYHLDSAWSTCEVYWRGLIDPPIALQQTDQIAGPTTPAGGSEAATTLAVPCSIPPAPTAEATRPAQPSRTGHLPVSTGAPNARIESSVGPGAGDPLGEPLETDGNRNNDSKQSSGDSVNDETQVADATPTRQAPDNSDSSNPDRSPASPIPEPVASPQGPDQTPNTTPSVDDGGDNTIKPPVAEPIYNDNSNQGDSSPSNALDVLSEAQTQPPAQNPTPDADNGQSNPSTPPEVFFTDDNGGRHTAVAAPGGNAVVIDDRTTAPIGATLTMPGNDPIVVESDGVRLVEGDRVFLYTSGSPQAQTAAGVATQFITYEGETYTVPVPDRPGDTATTPIGATGGAVVDVGGEPYTIRTAPGASGAVLEGSFSAVTLMAGETAVVGDQDVSVGEGGGILINGQPVELAAADNDGIDADGALGKAIVTAGSFTLTAAQAGRPGVVRLGQGSLSVGGPATTVDGAVLSLASERLVVSNNNQAAATTILLTPASANPTRAIQVQAVLPLGTITLTAHQIANSPSLIALGDTTLTANGHEVTVSGTVVSVASNGIILDSTSTISFETTTLNPDDSAQASELAGQEFGAWNAAPDSPSQVSAVLTLGSEVVTAFQVAGSPGVVLVAGTELSVGGDGITIGDVGVSVASGGVVVGEGVRTVAWSTGSASVGEGFRESGLRGSSTGSGSSGGATVLGSVTAPDGVRETGGVGDGTEESGAPRKLEWSLLGSGSAVLVGVVGLGLL